MKILWMRPFFLHPPHGGAEILTLNVLRRLKKRHEIHFLAHTGPVFSPQQVAYTDEFCSRAFAMQPPPPVKPRLRPYAAQLLREWMERDTRPTPEFIETAARLWKEENYDALVVDSSWAMPAIPPGARYSVLAINVEALIFERHARTEPQRGVRWHYMIKARRTRQMEIAGFRGAHQILALSQADADLVRKSFSPACPIIILPPGADVEGFEPPDPSPAPSQDLIFAGGMHYDPNVRGASWFCREVLPLIRARRPECTLAIVGQNPDDEVVRLGEIPGVKVTGTVPDTRPWFWGSRISIVPLLVGGGIRIKIYEAMAAGLPVVATSIGAEGLVYHPEKNILIGNTAQEFASHVLRLLENEQFRRQIAVNGRRLVAENFSWDNVADAMDAALSSAFGRPEVTTA